MTNFNYIAIYRYLYDKHRQQSQRDRQNLCNQNGEKGRERPYEKVQDFSGIQQKVGKMQQIAQLYNLLSFDEVFDNIFCSKLYLRSRCLMQSVIDENTVGQVNY